MNDERTDDESEMFVQGSENVSASDSTRSSSDRGATSSQTRASLTSDLSQGPTVGASIANLAARFPPTMGNAQGVGNVEGDETEHRSNTRKRSASGSESDTAPMPPPPKKSAATSAEHKRNREKQRRSELNETLDDLSELVFQIDPALRSGRAAEEVGMEDQQLISAGRKNTITNRTELIQCTVRLLKRIHAQNQEKDKIIAEFGVSAHQLSHQQRKGASNATPGVRTIPIASNATATCAGSSPEEFPGRMDPSTSIHLGPQTAFPPRMVGPVGSRNPLTDGHMHFGSGTVALPGLVFSGAFQGLLAGSSGSGFPGAPSHLLFGAATAQPQQQSHQQQGHSNQFAPPGPSSTGASVDFGPFQASSAALGHFPAPDRTRSRGQDDGKEKKGDARSDSGGR